MQMIQYENTYGLQRGVGILGELVRPLARRGFNRRGTRHVDEVSLLGSRLNSQENSRSWQASLQAVLAAIIGDPEHLCRVDEGWGLETRNKISSSLLKEPGKGRQQGGVVSNTESDLS